MTVINRLRRLTGEASRPVQPDSRAMKISELRRRIDAIVSRGPSVPLKGAAHPPQAPVPLAGVIEGEVIENEGGHFFAVSRTLPTGCCHGHRRIGDLSATDMRTLSYLTDAPALADLSLQDGIFLDTETTGLSGGSGTLAFMIGTGWFTGNAFTTLQIFLRDFSEERAALLFLQDLFAGKRFLVTFNGKTFDMNILTTRRVMNRLPGDPFALPHLDLLHVSRRLVGHRLPDCRLATLEESLLGLLREGDIPGSEIPARYFDWLRSRNGALLADVFEHNRLDVISLAALASYLSGLFFPDEPLSSGDHDDLPEVSRLLLERGYTAEAAQLLERGKATASYRAEESRRLLSLIYKRAGRWDEAVRLWTRMILDDPENIFAAVELAKWFEHHCRDDARAAALVLQVLPGCQIPQEVEALRHRLRRLQARTGR